MRDFDGGVVGQTLISTLNSTRTKEAPGWEIMDGDITDVVESVWDGTYWGALVVKEGASAALQQALANPTAGGYDPKSAITNYLTGARYFTTYSSYIRPAITQALAEVSAKMSGYAANVALGQNTGANSAEQNEALARLIAQAVGFTETDMAPLPFQSRVFINTFGVVVPNLATFFFNMIIMGVFTEAGVYSHPTTMFKLTRAKFVLKVVWCVLASLIMTSVNFSFREDYTYPAKNFFALWTDTLFYCWINFNIFGTILAYLPIKFIMYFVFPIIVTSVAAAVFPPEVGDIFYNISYIFPSHAYWAIAITIWGKGCCNRLSTYCPVVMAWVIFTELIWLSGDWHLSRKSREGAGVPPPPPDGGDPITEIVFPEEEIPGDTRPLSRSLSARIASRTRSPTSFGSPGGPGAHAHLPPGDSVPRQYRVPVWQDSSSTVPSQQSQASQPSPGIQQSPGVQSSPGVQT